MSGPCKALQGGLPEASLRAALGSTKPRACSNVAHSRGASDARLGKVPCLTSRCPTPQRLRKPRSCSVFLRFCRTDSLAHRTIPQSMLKMAQAFRTALPCSRALLRPLVRFRIAGSATQRLPCPRGAHGHAPSASSDAYDSHLLKCPSRRAPYHKRGPGSARRPAGAAPVAEAEQRSGPGHAVPRRVRTSQPHTNALCICIAFAVPHRAALRARAPCGRPAAERSPPAGGPPRAVARPSPPTRITTGESRMYACLLPL